MNELVSGEIRWVSTVDLIYELLRRLIGPENWAEEILVLVASVLLWRILTGQGRRGNPTSYSQPPEERRTLATSHQTRAAYPREGSGLVPEEDGTGCRDEFVNKIVVPLILIVLLVLLVGVVAGCG